MRRLGRAVAVLAAVLVLVAAFALAEAWFVLRPAAGEWRTTVPVAGRAVAVSVPALLRLATHPLAAPVLDGRTTATPWGHWQWQARADAPLQGRCAPCRVHLPAFGTQPLVLHEARLTVQRVGMQALRGTLWLGDGEQAVVLPWQAELAADGLRATLTMKDTPAADLLRALAASVPEAAVARVQGRVAMTVRVRFGVDAPAAGLWSIAPQVAGLSVQGLGTERFAAADIPAACRTARSGPVEGWLPRAVIAAEDQRFHEHGGYDLAELKAAWQRNQRRAGAADEAVTPHGASTLTQQLVKLLITGDDRSPARKLRELIYAVEMERTLGKGRILQLYLAVAPWGDGVCGAARAAEVHLGRPVDKLGPVASAWLASLLTNPQAQLDALATGAELDRDRLTRILQAMRPMARAQRELALEQLADWRPPMAATRIDAVAADASTTTTSAPDPTRDATARAQAMHADEALRLAAEAGARVAAWAAESPAPHDVPDGHGTRDAHEAQSPHAAPDDHAAGVAPPGRLSPAPVAMPTARLATASTP